LKAATPKKEFLDMIAAEAKKMLPVEHINGIIKPEDFLETRRMFQKFFTLASHSVEESWNIQRRNFIKEKNTASI
jgi:hypothetical protein